MVVNSIQKISKTKYLVALDNDIQFPLYSNEIKKFGIEENKEIAEETYNIIMNDILYKRALSRCNYLIAQSPKTKLQLTTSLLKSNYPELILNRVIEELETLNYINDERYCEDYINYYKSQKGINAIKISLIKKGISKEILDKHIEEIDVDSQVVSLRKLINHKLPKNKEYSYNDINKAKAYLARKGYSISLINKEIATYLEGDNCNW